MTIFPHRKYCPGIITTDEDLLQGKPKTQLSMLVKSRHKLRRTSSYSYHCDSPRSDPSWLYPIILPSIFPTLFALYKEHYAGDDHKVGHVIAMLDSQGDEELSRVLGIENKFEQWKSQGSGPRCSLSGSESEFSNRVQTATRIFCTLRYIF